MFARWIGLGSEFVDNLGYIIISKILQRVT